MNTNLVWEYDEFSGHYIIKNVQLKYVNFSGVEQAYNAAGRRNFKMVVPDDLANEMESRGIYVRRMEAQDDREAENQLKIGVYSDVDIRLLCGKTMTTVTIPKPGSGEFDGGPMLDREFTKGHAVNSRDGSEICVEFHVSRNTKVPSAAPYLRADMIVIPIRKSKLEDMVSSYEMEEEDEDLPM